MLFLFSIQLQTKEGSFLEAPRRVLIECPSWASRSALVLRILYAWAKEPPWPPKGSPVALALFIPLSEIKRSFANYVEKVSNIENVFVLSLIQVEGGCRQLQSADGKFRAI